MPKFPGSFAGELWHTSRYKSATQFRQAGADRGRRQFGLRHRGGRGAPCEERGHFGAAWLLLRAEVRVWQTGRHGGRARFKLPPWLKQRLDSTILKWFTGDPVRFGFPQPTYKMYESHPVVNSLILYHIGHGDMGVRGDIARFDGHSVHFKDGSIRNYDLIVAATGYKLHYPFLDHALLNWQGLAPQLYLNIFARRFDRLAVLGMVEASGLGWQGRYEQAELVARYLRALDTAAPQAAALKAAKLGPPPDLSGGYKYLQLERMAYYVHKDTYRNAVRAAAQAFQ
ncbi:MAG: hypothetical protein R3E42_12385 [Burkholderiaceae bacterium]